MNRKLRLLVLAGVLSAGAVYAEGPAGSWRMTVDLGGGNSLTTLLAFENKDGKWAGKYLGSTQSLPPKTVVQDVKVDGDRLRFVLNLEGQELSFDGRIPAAAGQRIPGSILVGNDLLLTGLDPSQLAAFERAGLLKEIVNGGGEGAAFFEAAIALLREATANKSKPDEVRAWADKAATIAGKYGLRWQRTIVLRIARVLLEQPDYVLVALAMAQRAERLLEPTDELAVQLMTLEMVHELLRKANKAAEANELAGRIAKLEERDLQEYAKLAPFQPQPFAGRKGKSDRVVLVEIFTLAECLPCVAADLAFDALGKSYKPAEVVLLQYHLHVPGPDPMTNPATEARARSYGDTVGGLPTPLFNGKAEAGGGGPANNAAKKFGEYQKVIDAALETAPGAKLQLTATKTGDAITAKVKVGDLAKPGPKIKLRLLLAEDHVRYRGGNGLRYHHCVVRGMFGSDEGIPLTAAASDHEQTLDLGAVRKGLAAYLDKYAKENDDMTFVERPLKLHRPIVVAFVQNDETKEVLQATQVEVK